MVNHHIDDEAEATIQPDTEAKNYYYIRMPKSLLPGETAGIPYLVLVLALEEMHQIRMDYIRELQESEIHVARCRATACVTACDEGGDPDYYVEHLHPLSLVHSSWTPVIRHYMGRILIFADPSKSIVDAASSSPIYGTWTREIYIKFRRNYTVEDPDAFWDAIRSLTKEMPNIITFTIITGSRAKFNIRYCVNQIADSLPEFARLQQLRLYSNTRDLGPNGRHFSTISEHPSLFRALGKLPNFTRLAIRNFFPCFKLACNTAGSGINNHIDSGDEDDSVLEAMGDFNSDNDFEDNSDAWSSNAYAEFKLVDSSVPSLPAPVSSLVNLIRTICNTPYYESRRGICGVGEAVKAINFVLDSTNRTFVVKSMHFDPKRRGDDPDDRDLNFAYEKWCENVEFLKIFVNTRIWRSFAPFRSLRVLESMHAASENSTPVVVRDELKLFIDALPPTLEILEFSYFWERRDEVEDHLPLDMHKEFDALLTTMTSVRCPKLKILNLDFSGVSELFDTTMPLTQLAKTCEELGIDLYDGSRITQEIRPDYDYYM